MIAVDLQPISIVENSGFRRLINFLAPQFVLKNRRQYSEEELPKCFAEAKHRVNEIMDNVEYLSLTTDGWTSKANTHSLLSVTVHFLDENFEPK